MNSLAVKNETIAKEHSAISHCNENVSCGKCFNNIIDDRGLILMLTPKVCSQSVIGSYREMNNRFIFWGSKKKVIDNGGEYLNIGFIRNPFDRVVSCWHWWSVRHQEHRTWPAYGIKPNCEFDEFVDIITDVPYERADKHWRPCSYDLVEDGLLLPHHLVRFESFAEDFETMRRVVKGDCGINLSTIKHRNSSGKKKYQEYYSDKTIEKVAKYYVDDLNNFGYEFNHE